MGNSHAHGGKRSKKIFLGGVSNKEGEGVGLVITWTLKVYPLRGKIKKKKRINEVKKKGETPA